MVPSEFNIYNASSRLFVKSMVCETVISENIYVTCHNDLIYGEAEGVRADSRETRINDGKKEEKQCIGS